MKKQSAFTPRVLVADDERAILNEFREILCPKQGSAASKTDLERLSDKLFPTTCSGLVVASFDLVLCRQGDEAVEKVRAAIKENNPFAVVFIDVRMPPGPDGIWTAEQIRALDPHVQIVVVTAYSDIDPLDIGRRVKPVDKLLYLQKPFHPHEIRQFASALGSKWLAEKQLQEQAAKLAKANDRLRSEIAEHKRTEEGRRLLSRAVMSTEDCVYITDTENRIIFVNGAFCETYRYDEEEVIGKDADILWAQSDPCGHAESAVQAAGGWEVGFLHRRKDGEEFPVSVSKSDVTDENGNQIALVVIARNISERMQTERELRAEIRHLRRTGVEREKVKAVSERLLVSLAALKDIIGDAKTRIVGRISQQLRKNLASAENHLDSATSEVNDLDELSKMETSRVEVGVD